MPTHHLKKPGEEKTQEEDICLFGQTNFRNQMRRFGVKTDDRRRHMYVVGKTGMGKTTMMENMVLQDIYKGHGLGVVDPHGDFAEKIINFIPPHRINDVVYFNPADTQYPIGFNVLEVKNEEQRHLVTAGLMGIFKKIWPDVWSSRMEYILNNTLAALLEYPGSTLLGINRLLAEKAYRRRVIKKVKDPVIKGFWQNEFAQYNDRYAQEAVAPIQNKIGQFLSANVIRNMVAQVKSTIDVRDIMDSGKIFIMNLAKGRIGEDNSRLLGGMLITKLQLAAMERVDIPEEERKDFFLYVDEFQNFASPSFANILSEARKYRLSLIMAHQYVAQLDEVVADAVFGNVGTIVTFRVGGADAEMLVKEFTPTFMEEDLVNLAKFHIFLKLMINGVASLPFSAITMPPIGSPTESAERVIKVSRERYAKERGVIEEKILRWSGMAPVGEGEDGEDDDGDEDEIPARKSRPPKQQFNRQQQPKKPDFSSASPRPDIRPRGGVSVSSGQAKDQSNNRPGIENKPSQRDGEVKREIKPSVSSQPQQPNQPVKKVENTPILSLKDLPSREDMRRKRDTEQKSISSERKQEPKFLDKNVQPNKGQPLDSITRHENENKASVKKKNRRRHKKTGHQETGRNITESSTQKKLAKVAGEEEKDHNNQAVIKPANNLIKPDEVVQFD